MGENLNADDTALDKNRTDFSDNHPDRSQRTGAGLDCPSGPHRQKIKERRFASTPEADSGRAIPLPRIGHLSQLDQRTRTSL